MKVPAVNVSVHLHKKVFIPFKGKQINLTAGKDRVPVKNSYAP
jgi:hypothetical protein